MRTRWAYTILLACVAQVALAATRYVDASPHTPVSPYTSWATAATNIQDAITIAAFADTILVKDGLYKSGPTINVLGNNRVFTMSKRLLIQSLNGPEVTVIQGSTNAATSSMRCVYLTDGSVLSGFTLTNGVTPSGGAGVYCDRPNCIVTNCIIAGNYGNNINGGGGAKGGTLLGCLLTNNLADANGGGAYSNTLINCTLISNRASIGGGACNCSLTNCLLVANTANSAGGGGAARSALNNCTVSNNVAAGSGNFGAYNGGGLYICSASDCLISSNWTSTGSGGGTYSCSLSNCVVQNNFAGIGGGGVSGGAVTNCVIANNATDQFYRQGGGAVGATLNNCVVTGNSATYGAGIASSVAINCTIVGNLAGFYGAGAYASTLQNSIIYYNQAATNADIYGSVLTNCCTSSLAYPNIADSFTNEPSFVDPNGDFHLQSDSPCINAGNSSFAPNTNDLDGNSRIVGGTVDVGAYEYQWPASVISYAWLQQYGLPTDGSADFADDDGDGMNTWQEWVAGTDPSDAASLLQMFSAIPTSNPPSVVVSWQSVAGKNYWLQRSANLADFSSVQSNVVGQAGITVYTDTNVVGNGPFFYRVSVQ